MKSCKKTINLGYNIRKIWKFAGLTQKELAEKMHVTVITIQNYENNRREPNLSTIEKIADALNVPVGMLLGFEVVDIEGNPLPNEVLENEYVEEMLEDVINNDISFIRLIYNRLFPNNRENIIDNISPSKASNIINSLKDTLEFELYKIKNNK